MSRRMACPASALLSLVETAGMPPKKSTTIFPVALFFLGEAGRPATRPLRLNGPTHIRTGSTRLTSSQGYVNSSNPVRDVCTASALRARATATTTCTASTTTAVRSGPHDQLIKEETLPRTWPGANVNENPYVSDTVKLTKTASTVFHEERSYLLVCTCGFCPREQCDQLPDPGELTPSRRLTAPASVVTPSAPTPSVTQELGQLRLPLRRHHRGNERPHREVRRDPQSTIDPLPPTYGTTGDTWRDNTDRTPGDDRHRDRHEGPRPRPSGPRPVHLRSRPGREPDPHWLLVRQMKYT